MFNTGSMGGIVVHHGSLLPRWSYLAASLFILCACIPPQPYENISHLNYGAPEYSADLAQCRNRSVAAVAITHCNNVFSGNGVDEVGTNAMAAQGWQEAPPSVTAIVPL
jgi:hypothetical protein